MIEELVDVLHILLSKEIIHGNSGRLRQPFTVSYSFWSVFIALDLVGGGYLTVTYNMRMIRRERKWLTKAREHLLLIFFNYRSGESCRETGMVMSREHALFAWIVQPPLGTSHTEVVYGICS